VYQRAERADIEAEKVAATIRKLEPRRTIRQVDVALDTVLTATKLTAMLLMSFVLREYLPESQLSLQTFLSRVFTLRGRREVTSSEERIIFYENPRDPRIKEVIVAACQRLNSRNLSRAGRRLVYSITKAPKSSSK
jgi:hypothetical protein